jgi:hypothetical protein
MISPTAIEAAGGLTVIFPTARSARINSATLDETPPADAVIVTGPGATPVTTPPVLTVATLGSDDIQATTPATARPDASRNAAVSVIDPPA